MDEDCEATHSCVRAVPGRVFARLVRATEDGDVIRAMFAEFTPAQALRLAQQLDESAREAIAMEEDAPVRVMV